MTKEVNFDPRFFCERSHRKCDQLLEGQILWRRLLNSTVLRNLITILQQEQQPRRIQTASYGRPCQNELRRLLPQRKREGFDICIDATHEGSPPETHRLCTQIVVAVL